MSSEKLNFYMINARNVLFIFEDFLEIQDKLIFFCNEDIISFEDVEDQLNSFLEILEKHDILNTRIEFKEFICFFSHFISYHKQNNDSIAFIEKIILLLKEKITLYLNQNELCIIFRHNPRIILFLYENDFIDKDVFIQKYIYQLDSPEILAFFYPEYSFLRTENHHRYKKLVKIFKPFKYHPQDYEINQNEFLEKRKIEFNESKVANLIKNDFYDEFIDFISKSNKNINSKIIISYFQSDPNLIYLNNPLKRPSFIDYAAFYGSIQIFKYLFLNDANITQKTWEFAIHGKNYEIIHLLEKRSNKINFKLCFNKAVYFHHNEIASYIKEQYLNDEIESLNESLISYNYQFIVNSINEMNVETFKAFFINLCIYGYNSAIEFFFKNMNLKEIIQNIKGNHFIFFIH